MDANFILPENFVALWIHFQLAHKFCLVNWSSIILEMCQVRFNFSFIACSYAEIMDLLIVLKMHINLIPILHLNSQISSLC